MFAQLTAHPPVLSSFIAMLAEFNIVFLFSSAPLQLLTDTDSHCQYPTSPRLMHFPPSLEYSCPVLE